MSRTLGSCWQAVQHVMLFLLAAACPARQERTLFTAVNPKPCFPGCNNGGNCNGDTGECECPYGFSGPDCRTRLLAACHSDITSNTSLPMFGTTFPKNCYCWKQLLKTSCRGGPVGKQYCFCTAAWDWGNLPCFVYKDLPEDQQTSDRPDPWDSEDVEWYAGVYREPWLKRLEVPLQLSGMGPFQLQRAEAPDRPVQPDGGTWEPLGKCPDRCSGRGWCSTRPPHDPWGAANSNKTMCMCKGHMEGPACEQPAADYCFNRCSGRGTCVNGFCHCQPGYWGLGCGRSKVYQSPAGWMPDHAELRIYVYDIPEHIAYRKPHHDYSPDIDHNYLAEVFFLNQLLNDTSGVRTENPWEANLFYIPTFGMWYYGNVGDPGVHVANIVDYVREAFPFWNLTLGRNHFLISSNDRGACTGWFANKPEVLQPIQLVHFGQAPRHRLDQLMAVRNDSLPGSTVLAQLARHKYDALPSKARFEGFPDFQPEALAAELEPCYRPERDVVLAGYLDPSFCKACVQGAFVVDPITGSVQHRHSNRPTLFYHYGYSKSQMAYSQGVRQALIAMFKNLSRQDISINKDYDQARSMLASRFCLAPMGFGWGIRLYKALRAGCVPVIIEDHVYPPYWDLLPYQEFSLRITRHNVHNLLHILDSVTPQQLERLQDGVAKYWRAFEWDPRLNGQAYNYTLQSLHRRLLHMWSSHFRHRQRLAR